MEHYTPPQRSQVFLTIKALYEIKPWPPEHLINTIYGKGDYNISHLIDKLCDHCGSRDEITIPGLISFYGYLDEGNRAAFDAWVLSNPFK